MATIMTREGAKCWWKVELPREIAYLHRDHSGEDWKKVTYKEIFAKKKAKQDSHIRNKRAHQLIKPAYIWVFYNDSWIFGGWWINIITLKKQYSLNFRTNWYTGPIYQQLVRKIMNLYPCGILPFDFETWANAFSKTHHHVGFKRTKQGLVKCLCRIAENGDLVDINKIIL
jgi:hypothetical protein